MIVTGASRRPVKNFLIFLETSICAGVTIGSLIHGFPGSEQTKYVNLLMPVPFSSFSTGCGGLKCILGGIYTDSFDSALSMISTETLRDDK